MISQDDMFDESIWTPPEELPDLSAEKIMAIDVETKDPYLLTRGPGWATGSGRLIGIAVAVSDWSSYLPIAHEGRGNMAKGTVIRWLKDQLKDGITTVYHNAQYDLGWLLTEGIEVKGPVLDTMIAAPLLDENRMSYSLNALSISYLGERKQEADLRRTARQHGVDAKAEMWKLPAARVALYAETDAKLTLSLWDALHKKILKDNCKDILELELSLLPLVFEMRKRGIRVDLEQAEKVKKTLERKEKKLLKEVKDETGVDIEPWNATSLALAFDNLNLKYELTEKSQKPSFTKAFLQDHKHPVTQKILEIREYNKANTTFVDTILDHQHKGRIHCEFNQLRSDGAGTVTGRFSSSHPNLQQLPSRHPEIKEMIRGLFLPEEGCEWASFDYSAQEPRWLMHYASLTPSTRDNEKVIEIVEQYQNDDLDFHQMVADLAGVERSLAKTINLGIMYGMGLGKLSNVLGVSFEEAREIRDEYDEKVPFIRALASTVAQVASDRKELRTLVGRKCRFPMREQRVYNSSKSPIHIDTLEQNWRDIMETPEEERDSGWKEHNPNRYRVAYTYKSLNKIVQASSADETKMAMRKCMDLGHLPMVTIHDELCFSIESREQVPQIKEAMENCVSNRRIPSRVDVGIGKNWGDAK